MIRADFEVRYVVVFQKDGLKLDSVLEDLHDYGEITEVRDDELISDNGERTKVILVCLTGSIDNMIRFKMDFNCVSAEDSWYVLFPMESLEEKREVERLRAIGA